MRTIALALLAFVTLPALQGCFKKCKDKCLNGGICITAGCECPDGYAGLFCEERIPFVVGETFFIPSWTYLDPSYFADIAYSEITQEIIDRGAVLVYYQTGSSIFSQLPLTFYQTNFYSTTIEVVTYVGGVRLVWTDSDLFQPNTPPPVTIKIVVIGPSAKTLYADLDWADYDEVQRRLDL